MFRAEHSMYWNVFTMLSEVLEIAGVGPRVLGEENHCGTVIK
jgi:hypothetical protein